MKLTYRDFITSALFRGIASMVTQFPEMSGRFESPIIIPDGEKWKVVIMDSKDRVKYNITIETEDY